MNQIYFIFGAIGAGACIAMQAAANGKFRHNLDSPDSPLFAAFFSICGTIITAIVAMLVLRPTPPTMESIRQTQWWNWIGGPLGAMIVLAGASLVRHLGGALFIALVVSGQLLCSLMLDHFALLGLPEQSITSGRIVGAGLVVAGVVCIKYL
jgi:transporter family-2 protein